MEYLFLSEDFARLTRRISRLKEEIAEAGREAGSFIHQSSETWHDNFGFEDAKRTVLRISADLEALLRIQAHARILRGPSRAPRSADIGTAVSVKESPSGKSKTYCIGSYFADEERGTISYASALGSILLGAKEGETRSGTVAGKRRKFRIEKITLP